METQLGSIVPREWQDSFAKARTALCRDDVSTARRLFDGIAEALPDNLEVRLCAAWARARLAESISDREHDALERLAREALATRQTLALPLCILAHGAIRRHDLRAARRLFRRAADADPDLVDARRGVRIVDHRLPLARAENARLVLILFVLLMSVAAAVARTVS
jgi:thioredoxin-like negative regulator of GroEL